MALIYIPKANALDIITSRERRGAFAYPPQNSNNHKLPT